RSAPAEKLRQKLGPEHWGAFQYACHRLADGMLELARGRRGAIPTTVLLLSGDVHFSHLARVRPRDGRTTSRIAQLVSSPLCNQLSPPLRRMARMSAT